VYTRVPKIFFFSKHVGQRIKDEEKDRDVHLKILFGICEI